jgi:plasmid stability protein
MPKSITVRDLPLETHAELKRRAAANGQSLQAYLLDFVVKLAERPDLAVIAARRQQQDGLIRRPTLTPESGHIDACKMHA